MPRDEGMTGTDASSSGILSDRWLVIIVFTVTVLIIWNSRSSLFPPPEGYAKYSDHGISFLYPDYLNPWQVPINDAFNVVTGGPWEISEERGCVGWNSGNVDNERPVREGYFQEANVIWLAMDPPPEPDVVLNLFYTAFETNMQTRNREYDLTKGATGFLDHRGHGVKYEFFNYTYFETGEDESIVVYGVLGAFYCDKSGRAVASYYMEIFDFEPVYDDETLLSTFEFYLDSLRCH